MEPTKSGTEVVVNEVVALRHFVTQFAATMFINAGGDKDKFDEFAQHTRSSLGLRPGKADEPGADVAIAGLPAILESLDRITAEVRRLLPS